MLLPTFHVVQLVSYIFKNESPKFLVFKISTDRRELAATRHGGFRMSIEQNHADEIQHSERDVPGALQRLEVLRRLLRVVVERKCSA